MTPALDTLFQQPVYGIPQTEKEFMLLPVLNELTRHHRTFCEAYRHITDLTSAAPEAAETLADIPYLPISLFKFRRLGSVKSQDVRVKLTSSGTGGDASRVDLDAETSRLSIKALSMIVGTLTQGQRMPMLIIDSEASIAGKSNLGARAAAILGLMPFGYDHCFALNDHLEFDSKKVSAFIERHKNQQTLIFGFTFLIWQKFLPACEKHGYDFSQALLLHGGGWKKLHDIAIDNTQFRGQLKRAAKITHIINFYGMAELPGVIFLENQDGLLYPPSFADVIIRDPITFQPQPTGKPGLIQILSALPRSFPGHSLLTEDMGVIESIDAGMGGYLGHGLRILGRAPRAELRGCSDVMNMGVAA